MSDESSPPGILQPPSEKETKAMKAAPDISVVFVSLLACALLTSLARATGDSLAGTDHLVYVGTAIYTGQNSKAIYACRFNTQTGRLTSLELAAESNNPGFVFVHPNRRFLYAVKEIGDKKIGKGGAVTAFSINPETGKLTFLNEVAAHGAHPCHVTVDKTGKYVLVANYFGGTVESFPVGNDGRLGQSASVVRHSGASVNRARQEGPHPHSVVVSPDNRFAISADLGIDKLMIYRFSSMDGSLESTNPPHAEVKPGAGPRHLVFSPNGKFVYVVNELNSSVSAFAWDSERGALHLVETVSTLPKSFKGGNSGAEIEVSSSGKFLYVSNRGHDSIAVFSIDTARGLLTPVEYVPTQGKTPRHFTIDPSGSYLIVANQESDTIVVFRINTNTGRLTSTGQELKVRAPVCVEFAT